MEQKSDEEKREMLVEMTESLTNALCSLGIEYAAVFRYSDRDYMCASNSSHPVMVSELLAAGIRDVLRDLADAVRGKIEEERVRQEAASRPSSELS